MTTGSTLVGSHPVNSSPDAAEIDPTYIRGKWAIRAQTAPGTAHVELSEWAARLRATLPPWRAERLVTAAVRGLVDGSRAALIEDFD